MSSVQLGDLAQSYQLRSENARLKREVAVLTEELSTGQTADLAARVSGDLTPITGIEHDLARLDGYRTALTESRVIADSMQAALETVQSLSEELYGGLIVVGTANDPSAARAAGIDAEEKFQAMVGTLSTQAGGRSLFAGIATDQPALAPADDILAALRTATAGLTDAGDIVATVEAWFGPGGDFETLGYGGSTTALSPVAVSRDISVTMDVTALDTRLRDLLAATAMGALAAEGALDSAPQERVALAAEAGARLMSTQTNMATLRAEVGATQNTLEQAEQANGTSRYALELARSQIVAIDPYEKATQLETAQIQLESLYAMTARLNRLSLVDFLR